MADEKPKKKRFEGLIQFKDALRQTVVCLQAAMESRFLTSVQSALIKQLDEQAQGSAHHLLFVTRKGDVPKVESLTDISPKHLLARIKQVPEGDIRDELKWQEEPMPHATIYLDASDQLVSQFFFQMISVACQETDSFDLSQCLTWGGALCRQNLQQKAEASQCLENWQQEYRLSADRTLIMNRFVEASAPLLGSFLNVTLMSDGSYIGLLIEGRGQTLGTEAMAQTLQILAETEAHTIVINLAKSQEAVSQFLMLTPIREVNRTLNQQNLKGFILLQNMLSLPVSSRLQPPQTKQSA